MRRAAVKLVAAVLAVAAYALASHWLVTADGLHDVATAVVLGPLLAALLVWSVQQRRLLGVVAAVAGIAALAVVVARGGAGSVQQLVVLQHAGVHAALAIAFALSLRRGATPAITALAERVHGRLTDAMRAYSRRVTLAWLGYFAAMTALSLAVYALAPWPAWSLLANVLTPLLIAALLVGEHVLRYRWHPEFERATLAQAVRAWREAPLRGAEPLQ